MFCRRGHRRNTGIHYFLVLVVCMDRGMWRLKACLSFHTNHFFVPICISAAVFFQAYLLSCRFNAASQMLQETSATRCEPITRHAAPASSCTDGRLLFSSVGQWNVQMSFPSPLRLCQSCSMSWTRVGEAVWALVSLVSVRLKIRIGLDGSLIWFHRHTGGVRKQVFWIGELDTRTAPLGYKLAVAIDPFGNGKRLDSKLFFFYKTHHDFCSVVDGGITALPYSLVIY